MPECFYRDPYMLKWLRDALSASVAYAYNPILYAVAQQTAKEVIAFLLGSLPQVRRKREVETGDDSRCVSSLGNILQCRF
jgi:hypothetical protein